MSALPNLGCQELVLLSVQKFMKTRTVNLLTNMGIRKGYNGVWQCLIIIYISLWHWVREHLIYLLGLSVPFWGWRIHHCLVLLPRGKAPHHHSPKTFLAYFWKNQKCRHNVMPSPRNEAIIFGYWGETFWVWGKILWYEQIYHSFAQSATPTWWHYFWVTSLY